MLLQNCLPDMIYKFTVGSASPVTIMGGCRGPKAFGAGLWAALGGRPSFLAGELAARVPALVPRP